MKNMTVGKKITLGFAVVLTLLVVVGVAGYVSLNKVQTEMASICYQLEIAKKANTVLVDTQDVQAGSLRYIIYRDDKYYQVTRMSRRTSSMRPRPHRR
ncbi:MAG: MCP four helix bundle domain-containing protein [Planctomycetes bacterium]|nr:MCP four helix bundle domain-containing protein [Planctomycetota bacterium]